MNRRGFLRNSASVGAVSMLAGCSTLGVFGSDEPFTVIIDYAGPWSGSVGSTDGQRSVQGSGREEFEIEGDIVSAVAQKRDGSYGRLTVLIAVGDNVVAGKYTTAQYGGVSVSHRRGDEDEVSGEVNLDQTTNQPEQSEKTSSAQLGVDEVEVESMVSYVEKSPEGAIIVDFEVYNPTSEIAEGQVRARFKLLGDGRNWVSGPVTTPISVDPDTTAGYSLVLRQEEFEDEGFDVDSLSPKGNENAMTCESGQGPRMYRCNGLDYQVAISVGSQRVRVDFEPPNERPSVLADAGPAKVARQLPLALINGNKPRANALLHVDSPMREYSDSDVSYWYNANQQQTLDIMVGEAEVVERSNEKSRVRIPITFQDNREGGNNRTENAQFGLRTQRGVWRIWRENLGSLD